MKTHGQRRNFFIKKDLQGKFIYHSFLLTFAGVIIFALIFSALSADDLTITYHDQQLRIGRTPLILLKEILTAHWLFLVSAGLFTAVNTLLLSHRIAGPIYRLERTFAAMETRNLNQDIHLRPKDLGKELTHRLNRINAMLSADLHNLRKLCEEIEQTIEAKDEIEDRERLAKLRHYTGELKKNLAAYQLRPETK